MQIGKCLSTAQYSNLLTQQVIPYILRNNVAIASTFLDARGSGFSAILPIKLLLAECDYLGRLLWQVSTNYLASTPASFISLV